MQLAWPYCIIVEQLRKYPQPPNMYSLIISILLSLNLINSPQEFFDLTPEQQQEYQVITEDLVI